MKLALLLLLASLAAAIAEPPVLSTSPDGNYLIRVEYDPQQGRLGYALVRVSSNVRLLLLPSSYQPDPPYTGKDDTEAANVDWAKDSRSVAIDETNVRYKGTVLAAIITKPEEAEEIPMPFDEIVRLSGEHWDRVRLWLGGDESWGPDGELHLVIAGKAWTEKVPGAEKGLSQDKGYDVTLRPRRHFEVTSLVSPPPDE